MKFFTLDRVLTILLGVYSVVTTLVVALTDSPFWLNTLLILIFVILFLVFIVWLFYKRSLFYKETLNDIENSFDHNAFWNYWVDRKNYIPMEITTETKEDAERIPLVKYLSSLMNKKQIELKYICLMGDIGSGKTHALVHYLEEYIKKNKSISSLPSKIKLYPMNMGYNNLINRIREDYPKNSDRANSVLLLDALDECKEARQSLVNNTNNNPRIFMEKLAEDTKDFASVVVTCRRQFFMCEEFKPDKTPIVIGNPSGPDPFLHWQKLYLAPFNCKQVKKYLSKRFGKFNNNQKRKEANRIVFSCEDLFLRPLLLTHIDIVLDVYRERQEPLTMKSIYDAIVYYWIKREANNDQAQISKLLYASISFAAFLYQNDLASLNEEQYLFFCNEYGITDSDNLLRVKSLLANDDNGYSFSHKSFYEYFLAYWFFLDSDRMCELKGLDFALQVYGEIYEANKSKEKSSEIDRLLLTQDVPNNCLAVGLEKLANSLFEIQDFSLAEKYYQDALVLYRQLVTEGTANIKNVALILLDLAFLHDFYTNHISKAEAEYQEALDIIRQLEDEDSNEFLPSIAIILNDLASLHWNNKLIEKAEEEYQESLVIWRQLKRRGQYKFLSDMAMTLFNMATLHVDIDRTIEANLEYQEALNTWRQLENENPGSFLPAVAMTLNEQAYLKYNNNNFTEAEAEYHESLIVHRQLAKEHPELFLLDLIMTLNSLATLHDDIQSYDKAKEEFQEAMYISSTIDDEVI